MIADRITKVYYQGNGSTTAFPFSFPFNSATDIKAVIHDTATDTETAITAGYYIDTVSKVFYYPGYAPGQEVPEAQRPAKLTSGQKIYIYRDTPETQLVDLGEKYPLPVIETITDKLCMIVQEHAEVLDRCVKGSISSTISLGAATIEEIYAGRDAAVASAAAAASSASAASSSASQASTSATAAGTSAGAAAASAVSASGYAAAAEASKVAAANQVTLATEQKNYAAANANSAIASADEAKGYKLQAADYADSASTAKAGAQHWAELANEYVEPLRTAMATSMFEYDSNADLQLVANPLAAASTTWETDSNGDVMPAA